MNDKELFAKYVEKMDSFNDENFSNMASDLIKGQNSYFRMKFKGSSIFNPSWIKKIEDCLYELGQIINNPREVTTQEGAVMPIELAKKINGESVQHLAAHTQYIKEITESGDVVPAKILGQYNKDEIHTYENRFIATFIRRLILFVGKRYEFIKNIVNLDEKDVMYIKNKSIVNGQEVEIETKISVKRETQDELAQSARDYIARIEKLQEYVSYYYNSPFMREFKTEKDVKKPIVMTNVLRKNPLYSKCYDTFSFIEKFDSLGVAYKADRKYQEFTAKQRKNLNYILLSSLLSLESTEEAHSYKKTSKTYKPKVLPYIDDEIFTYGELVKGPIEFVRSDEAYQNYKMNSIKKDLPLHPNAAEKVYYQDEYDKKKAVKKDVDEVEALLARVRRQIAKYEKLVDKFVAKRNIEEAEQAKLELARLKAQEQEILNKKRQEIIDAAKLEDVTVKEEEKIPEPVIEETPAEEIPVQEEVTPEPEPVVEEPINEPAPIEESVEEVKEEPQEEAQPVEEEKVEEPAPEVEPEPVIEEQVQEEPQVEEVTEPEPVVEETPVIEPAPIEEEKVEEAAQPVEEEPQVEPEPIPEPIEEEKPEETGEVALVVEPAPVEEVKEEEKPAKVEKKARTAKKSSKKAPTKKAAKPKEKAAKPAKKEKPAPAPKKEEKKQEPVKQKPVKKEKKVAPKKAPVKKPAPRKEERKPIPGKFIVKTLVGYYVNSKKLSDEKGDAFIFDDFNKAKDIKDRLGGKIVKL